MNPESEEGEENARRGDVNARNYKKTHTIDTKVKGRVRGRGREYTRWRGG